MNQTDHATQGPLNTKLRVRRNPRQHARARRTHHTPQELREVLALYIDANCEALHAEALRRCRSHLPFWARVDAEDCAQDIMVEIRKVSFIQSFDPALGTFGERFNGVCRVVSANALDKFYKRRRDLSLGSRQRSNAPESPSAREERLEVGQAIADVRETLPVSRLDSLDRVIGQAAGRPISGRCRRPKAEYGRDCRMRRYLRDKLRSHELPGLDTKNVRPAQDRYFDASI